MLALLYLLQWNLSKAYTYGTKVFVHFRGVSALERFELKSSQILRYGWFTLDPLSQGLLLLLIWLWEWGMVKKEGFFCNVSVYLTSKFKVASYFLLLSISGYSIVQLFSYHFQRLIYFAILILPGKTRYLIY